MVLKKKTYYGGFHGFLAPVIPKAPRSSRRRNLHRKSPEGGEICAFELLAAVAGKLLQESESSTSSIPEEDIKPEPPLKELSHSDKDSGVEHASIVRTSDFMNKNGTNVNLEAFEGNNGVCDSSSKLEGGSLSDAKLCEIHTEAVEKTRVPNNSSKGVRLSFYRGRVPSACFPRPRGNVKIDIRDDDEKFFRGKHRNFRRREFGTRSRDGYRRMRKIMSSRYQKVSPKMKDYGHANTTSNEVKSFYHKRKSIYMRERFQAEAASKRRKLFHHSAKTACIWEASSESTNGYKRRPPAALNKVKLSIKSFKVPELYVEVPETATVGSLKRTVMEAVTAILQGQLHVGVLLQGKKVRDDNRTLEQTGISKNCNLQTLGFTLEPSLPEASSSPVQKEPPLLLPCDARSPASPILDVGFSNSSPDPPPLTTFDHHAEENQESITLTDEQTTDSKALVVVPPRNLEALSMVPLSEKPTKRYELSQRRTRRPFSVLEVEALVEAVETLGAGRWRDVKMRAFDDADHRTYVDLKDKWKTLVHTASISPQQRRGEPVPQVLLDRVLAAHAYWSHPQSKHHKPA